MVRGFGGVTLYDGETFTTWTEQDGLMGFDVWSLFVDDTDTLWIGTLAGATRFDGHSVETLDVMNETSTTFVGSLLADESGGVWLGTGSKGLLHFDGTSFTTVFERDGFSVGALHRDAQGTFWFSSHGHGACRYDGTSLTILDEEDGLRGGLPFAITEDDRERIWFVGFGGASRYDGDTVVNVTRAGPW